MITVIAPGLLTTVQDQGRRGYRAFGVPLAGAMDRYAYAVANLLVGNPADAAALELTLVGGTFRFDRDAVVALCGADMQARLDEREVPPWSAVRMRAGQELALGPAASGCRTYLAVSGGIEVPKVLKSRSTYTRAGIGGFAGRALRAGDELPVGPGTLAGDHMLPARFIPEYGTEVTLRLLPGPQDDFFTSEGLETLFSSTYSVTERNDRMGYQLEGSPVQHRKGADIVSDALCPGAVQIPGSGRPMVLTADCQTTGGYAKVGVVIGPDLGLLAQARMGNTVRFSRCHEAAAVDALRVERETLRDIGVALNASAPFAR